MVQSISNSNDISSILNSNTTQSTVQTSFLSMAQSAQATSDIQSTASLIQRLNTDENSLYVGYNSAGASYKMEYAETSTDNNPQILVSGFDEYGQEFQQIININNINIYSATVLEMKALETYMMESNMGSNIDRMGGFFPTNDELLDNSLTDTINLMSLFDDMSTSSNYDLFSGFSSSSTSTGDIFSNDFLDGLDYDLTLILEYFKNLGSDVDTNKNEIELLYEQQKMLLSFNSQLF